mgnify:CR=1 FL=1
MTRTDVSADDRLRRAVEDSLASSLGVIAPHIGVAAEDGTITLCGEITGLDSRDQIVAAVLEVDGVRAVADQLRVHDPSQLIDSDTELATAAQHALSFCDGLESQRIVVEVRERVLTLVGTVTSSRQRLAAERAVLGLPGLVQIRNRITVDPAAD